MAGLFNAVVSAGKFVKDKLKVISSTKNCWSVKYEYVTK